MVSSDLLACVMPAIAPTSDIQAAGRLTCASLLLVCHLLILFDDGPLLLDDTFSVQEPFLQLLHLCHSLHQNTSACNLTNQQQPPQAEFCMKGNAARIQQVVADR